MRAKSAYANAINVRKRVYNIEHISRGNQSTVYRSKYKNKVLNASAKRIIFQSSR